METVCTFASRIERSLTFRMLGRSRDGTQTTEIELATKILDCDGELFWREVNDTADCRTNTAERIRNTLSHEM